jgi:hypothetical protein
MTLISSLSLAQNVTKRKKKKKKKKKKKFGVVVQVSLPGDVSHPPFSFPFGLLMHLCFSIIIIQTTVG